MKNELRLDKTNLLHLKDSQMAALLGGQEYPSEPNESSTKMRFCGDDETANLL